MIPHSGGNKVNLKLGPKSRLVSHFGALERPTSSAGVFFLSTVTAIKDCCNLNRMTVGGCGKGLRKKV